MEDFQDFLSWAQDYSNFLSAVKELYPGPDRDAREVRDRLVREGADAWTIELEVARARQWPLFGEDPAHPLRHGDPPGGDSWDLVHERMLSNIERAMEGRRIDGRRMTASGLAPFLPNSQTGQDGVSSTQARKLLNKSPEEMTHTQALETCKRLGCTLDYLRGLVDDPGQIYRTASEDDLLSAYRGLSPDDRRIAWRVIRALAAEESRPSPIPTGDPSAEQTTQGHAGPNGADADAGDGINIYF